VIHGRVSCLFSFFNPEPQLMNRRARERAPGGVSGGLRRSVFRAGADFAAGAL